MKLNRTSKILIASGVTLLTGALFLGRKARASSLNRYTLPAGGNTGSSIVVTDHDRVYDYKYENGTWYTQKKGSTNWTNMQAALSPNDYRLAVSRLQKYVQP